MDPGILSLVSALTALTASVAGPLVTLTVAKRQFNATVLSGNRQRWIESTRDLLAELISQFVGIVVIKKGRTDSWEENLETVSTEPELLRRIERIVLLEWKIRLLLNPAKPDHAKLAAALEAMLERLKKVKVDPLEARVAIEEITKLSQAILWQEWQRVKKGI
jgi:hypothetical protein